MRRSPIPLQTICILLMNKAVSTPSDEPSKRYWSEQQWQVFFTGTGGHDWDWQYRCSGSACPRSGQECGLQQDPLHIEIVPPYLRKAKSVEELLLWLYLKGISTGDFSEALSALLGPEAEGLSASTISRLKKAWWDEFQDWSKRDLSTKR